MHWHIRERLLVIFLVLGAAATGWGALAGQDRLTGAGGILLTIASLDLSHRLWLMARTAKAAEQRGEPMRAWQIGPGFLVAYLMTAGFMAALALDAGSPEVALLILPGAVALLLLTMGRAWLGGFVPRALEPWRLRPTGQRGRSARGAPRVAGADPRSFARESAVLPEPGANRAARPRAGSARAGASR